MSLLFTNAVAQKRYVYSESHHKVVAIYISEGVMSDQILYIFIYAIVSNRNDTNEGYFTIINQAKNEKSGTRPLF